MPWLFVKAIWKHWWALMSSAVFTLLGIYAAARHVSNDWFVAASLVIAPLLLVVAAYLAWRDEHEEVLGLQGRPEVSLGIVRIGGRLDGYYVFQLSNAAEDTAMNVSLSPITDGVVVYEFDSIPSIVKSPAPTSMTYHGKMAAGSQPQIAGHNSDMVAVLGLNRRGAQSFKTALEFSNYTGTCRWQVEYFIDCDFDSKTMTCRAGAFSKAP